METPHSFRKFKKEPLIFSLLFLGLSLAAFLFLYGRISANKTTSAELEKKWQAESSRREEIRSLERLLEDIESGRVELDSHFARSSNVVPFLDTLEELGLAVAAKPEIVSVDITKDKSALQVDMRATGTFEAVYKFLLLLESSPFELEFMTVDLHKTGEAGSDWAGSYKFKLLSFIP